MGFVVECDGIGGLVLFDKARDVPCTPEFVSALDFLLDVHGETELRCDYPNEPWPEVHARESALVRTLCAQGNAAIIILPPGDHRWHVEVGASNAEPCMWVQVETGPLIGVSAQEITQCALYPELDMEILVVLPLAPGWYQIAIVHGDTVVCTPCPPPAMPLSGNIQFEGQLA